MADSGVYDRWHKSRADDDEPRCAEHGLAPSGAHLSGDRWQARWRDDTGAQRKANFARKQDAARHAATAVADTARGTYVDPRTGKITLREYAGDLAPCLDRRRPDAGNSRDPLARPHPARAR